MKNQVNIYRCNIFLDVLTLNYYGVNIKSRRMIAPVILNEFKLCPIPYSSSLISVLPHTFQLNRAVPYTLNYSGGNGLGNMFTIDFSVGNNVPFENTFGTIEFTLGNNVLATNTNAETTDFTIGNNVNSTSGTNTNTTYTVGNNTNSTTSGSTTTYTIPS